MANAAKLNIYHKMANLLSLNPSPDAVPLPILKIHKSRSRTITEA